MQASSTATQTSSTATQASSTTTEAATAHTPPVPQVKPEKSDLSNLTATEKRERKLLNNRIRNQKHTEATHDVQQLLSEASIADVGRDVYRGLATNGFQWTVLPKLLASNNLRIVGYPKAIDIRLPGEYKGVKASNAMRVAERKAFHTALDARAVDGQGYRVENHTYVTGVKLLSSQFRTFLMLLPLVGGLVILSHDYSIPAPAGSPTSPGVVMYWRTSSGLRVPCIDGEGNMWETA
jgi:hypothetical protein